MKASVLPVIQDHIKTMYDARNGRVSRRDLAFFYGVPILVSIAYLIFAWGVRGLDNLLAALSIMTGLLFNLLVLLFDTAVRTRDRDAIGKQDPERVAHRYELIHELQANITYTLGVGLFTAVLLGAFSLAGIENAKRPWSALVVVFLAHFVLLLGMLLKRLRAVFIAEFPRDPKVRVT